MECEYSININILKELPKIEELSDITLIKSLNIIFDYLK